MSALYPHGWVAVGEHRFAITAVWLEDGRIKVSFNVRGPHAGVYGPVVVYGSDGHACWQGRLFELEANPDSSAWTCTYGMKIDTVYGVSEGESLPLRFL